MAEYEKRRIQIITRKETHARMRQKQAGQRWETKLENWQVRSGTCRKRAPFSRALIEFDGFEKMFETCSCWSNTSNHKNYKKTSKIASRQGSTCFSSAPIRATFCAAVLSQPFVRYLHICSIENRRTAAIATMKCQKPANVAATDASVSMLAQTPVWLSCR